MRRLIAAGAAALLLCAAALAPGACASRQREARPLTAEVREQTFDRYWSELDRHYPFFERAGVDWRVQRERWRDAAVRAESPSEFYGTLAAMLSALGDPHVALRPASRARGPGGELERSSTPYIGLAWVGRRLHVRRWPEDAAVIDSSDGGDDLPDAGYPEVVEIAGVPPQRNMTPLLLHGPEFSTIDLVARWPDGVERTVRLTRPSADFGGAATTGWAGPPRLVHPAFMEGTVLEHPGTLRREVSIRWDDGTVTWMDFDGGVPTPGDAVTTAPQVIATASGGGGGGAAGSGEPRVAAGALRRSWGDWLTMIDLGEVGYLRVATLDYEDAAGGIPLETMIDSFDAAVTALLAKPAVILDLRYNGGGRPRSLAAMMGRFVERTVELSSPTRRFAGLWPYRYATRVDPRPPVYTGRLVVLVNGDTGSAAEHWASMLQQVGRAVVVGERTTGAEALVEIVRGPDGSELRYGWLRFVDDRGSGIQGIGVVPDVGVRLEIGRVRELGYAAAVAEAERTQFLAACAVLGIDGRSLLGEVPELDRGDAEPGEEPPPAAEPAQGEERGASPVTAP